PREACAPASLRPPGRAPEDPRGGQSPDRHLPRAHPPAGVDRAAQAEGAGACRPAVRLPRPGWVELSAEHWKEEPEEHDYPAALSYLSLVLEPKLAGQLV